jgi:mRNA-degrading endonuclease RelE of RelBE toxin-antitoxin system
LLVDEQHYEIEMSAAAIKQFFDLERGIQLRLKKKIDSLSQEPRPRGCEKLKGFKNAFRIVVGDYRWSMKCTTSSGSSRSQRSPTARSSIAVCDDRGDCCPALLVWTTAVPDEAPGIEDLNPVCEPMIEG